MTLTDDIQSICDDLILSYRSNNNKFDTFCHCKHTLEHMGWEEETYFGALGYIAKELGLEQ